MTVVIKKNTPCEKENSHKMSHQQRPKKRKNICSVCQESRFRKSDGGFLVCRNGHLLASSQEEVGEEGFSSGRFVRQQTRVKHGKKVQAKGFQLATIEHYLEAYAFALKRHAECLITKLCMPIELEVMSDPF
jgi:hypothetical protein